MTFRILALPAEPFAHLAALSDPALAERDIRRLTVDECPGTPCRVSLEDAAVGETVHLLPWAHLVAASPYRASGPIFVREAAIRADPEPGEVPDMIRRRLLSARAYDEAGMMVTAEVLEGRDVADHLTALFADDRVREAHLHFARQGCFGARAVPA
jgi:hypothetical protein